MAVTTKACERCCLKYEKPVSQLYTPHPLLGSPRLSSHHHVLHLPSAGSSLLPFRKTELFPTCELQLHFPGQSSGGNVAPAGAASPLPSARSRGSAGAGEGPGAAVGGFDPHLLEAGGEGGEEGVVGGGGGPGGGAARGGARRRALLGVLTVPKLKLSAAASAGKLRGARGPRTKLEKSKQAAAAGEPPSFPLTLLPALALPLPSNSWGLGGGRLGGTGTLAHSRCAY